MSTRLAVLLSCCPAVNALPPSPRMVQIVSHAECRGIWLSLRSVRESRGWPRIAVAAGGSRYRYPTLPPTQAYPAYMQRRVGLSCIYAAQGRLILHICRPNRPILHTCTTPTLHISTPT